MDKEKWEIKRTLNKMSNLFIFNRNFFKNRYF